MVSPGGWMTAETEKLPGSLSWKCSARSTSRARVWPAPIFIGPKNVRPLGLTEVPLLVLTDEIEPLEAAIAAEKQFPARVIGDGDYRDDGFASQMLFFGDLERSGELGMRRTRRIASAAARIFKLRWIIAPEN